MAVVGERALDRPSRSVPPARRARRSPFGMPSRRLSASSSSREVGAAAMPIAAFSRVELVADIGRVEAHDRRHQDRVQRAVMQLQILAARRARGSARAPRRGPSGTTARLRARPSSSRSRASRSLPSRDRALDVAPDAAGAVERDRLGRRIDARRQEGLDAMRERVEAGRGGQHRAAGRASAPGSQMRALRDEMRADEAELAAVGERQQRRAARPRRRCRRSSGSRSPARPRRDPGEPAIDRRVLFQRPHASRAAPRPWRDRSASRRRARRCRRSPSAR